MIPAVNHPFQCPTCSNEGEGELDYVEADTGSVGAYICMSCGAWYPFEQGVTDFSVGSFRDTSRAAAFSDKYGPELGLAVDRVELPGGPDFAGNSAAQQAFFDHVADVHDEEMLGASTFWSASDELVVDRWAAAVSPSSSVIDLGAGTGRCALALAGRLNEDALLLAVDVSREMLVKGAKNFADAGMPGRAFLAVGDCSNLAFVKSDLFDIGTAHGLLHHVLRPEEIFEAWARVSSKRSNLFVHDNNDTALRSLFDRLMERKALWDGGGHEWEPVISEGDLIRWSRTHGMEADVHTSVFVPPHLCAAVSHQTSVKILSYSDALGRAIPVLRDHGGILLAEVYRGAPALLGYGRNRR